MKRRDWIGLWFEIQAERGHGDQVPLFLVKTDPIHFRDFSFRHRDKDGVAALNEAFRQLGLKKRPAAKPMLRPPWRKIPRLAWRGLAGNSGGDRPNWRSLHPEITRKPRAFTFLLLKEKQERALIEYLAKEGVSLTAYLLAKLGSAMEPELLAGPVSGAWLLPVDMRAAYPGWPALSNCVSFVKVPAAGNAREIHQAVKRALGGFEHWSNWWIYHIGKVVGLNGMRRLSKRAAERTFWLGSFTDLGDWSPESSEKAEEFRGSVWSIAAPGTPNNPVGCGTIAWLGRRSISLRIHPSLSESPILAKAILERLAHAIAADTRSDTGEVLQIEIGD